MIPHIPLFVPADRPERFEKAAMSGADAVILDCEDAVASSGKDMARRSLRTDFTDLPVYIRINGAGTPWHEEDLRAVATLPKAGIIVPKAEADDALAMIAARPEWRDKIIALVETVRGLARARDIAAIPGISVLAFGSVDFSADCGCAHTRSALSAARSELVMASRLAGIAAPIDGVSTSLDDDEQFESDARYAMEMGFGGKLCIHPRQIPAVIRGLRPTGGDIEWARSVMAVGPGAAALNGVMIDKAMQLRATSILDRLR